MRYEYFSEPSRLDEMLRIRRPEIMLQTYQTQFISLICEAPAIWILLWISHCSIESRAEVVVVVLLVSILAGVVAGQTWRLYGDL